MRSAETFESERNLRYGGKRTVLEALEELWVLVRWHATSEPTIIKYQVRLTSAVQQGRALASCNDESPAASLSDDYDNPDLDYAMTEHTGAFFRAGLTCLQDIMTKRRA